MLGLIGGAGALTAMVPAAIIILSASTLFSKNLVRPVFAPGMTDNHVAALARFMVVALSLISFYFAVHSSTTLVSLALLGYAGVAQFFPGVIMSLCWKRTTMAGAACGIAAGVGGTAALVLANRDPFHGMNAGFVGLCANFGAIVLVSLLGPARAAAMEATVEDFPPAAADES